MVKHWQEHRLLEDAFVAQLTAALQADAAATATTTTPNPNPNPNAAATATTSEPTKADSSPSAGSATARSVRTPASTEVASTTARGGAGEFQMHHTGIWDSRVAFHLVFACGWTPRWARGHASHAQSGRVRFKWGSIY